MRGVIGGWSRQVTGLRPCRADRFPFMIVVPGVACPRPAVSFHARPALAPLLRHLSREFSRPDDCLDTNRLPAAPPNGVISAEVLGPLVVLAAR